MNWKQFFKPEWRKALVMIILIVLTWISYIFAFANVITFAYMLLIVGFPMLIGELIIPLKTISLLIYWFLLSSFIVWIYDKVNKTIKVYEMRKVHWIVLVIAILIFLFLTFQPFPHDYCNLIKDYKITVNNAQEAANLINDYYITLGVQSWENITAENINTTENDFRYMHEILKIDKNGKLFDCGPPI